MPDSNKNADCGKTSVGGGRALTTQSQT